MQALVAAGIPHLGEAFPEDWGTTALRDANDAGFYEGPYVNGVFYGTNPLPGAPYLTPDALRGKVAKVFVPGILKTERAYIEGVIANVREWRAYEQSAIRLHELNAQRRRESNPDAFIPDLAPPHIEWWVENFALVRDAQMRQYPLQLHTYDAVLASPKDAIGEALELIGAGDLQAGMSAVDPDKKTKSADESTSVDAETAEVFDTFYDHVARRQPLSPAFNQACKALFRAMREELWSIRQANLRRGIEAGEPLPPLLALAASMG